MSWGAEERVPHPQLERGAQPLDLVVVAEHGAGVRILGDALVEPVGELVEVGFDVRPRAQQPGVVLVPEPDPPLHLDQDVLGAGQAFGVRH
jgi:hypothetical protein